MNADHEHGNGNARMERMMAIVRWVILAVTMVAAAGTWWSFAFADHARVEAAHPKYHCPMHPQIVSDKPGECPICHMALEPIPEKPKGSSPVPAASASSMPPGTRPVQLRLDRIQSTGVRTVVATEKTAAGAFRVTASVQAPEQGETVVHVRSPGFVEQIAVSETGVLVRAGQVLFSIYSPEIYQAETEVLAARKWAKNDGQLPSGDGDERALLAAKRKLELLGMAAADVEAVVQKGEATRTVAVRAPASGYVTKKNVVRGAYVTPETVLYEIQDLSKVYIVADVFPSDIGAIRVGAVGTYAPSARPETRVRAVVDLIYPVVRSEARTTRVRMQVANKDRALQPGEYGTVEFATAEHHVVVVPRDAVVDTGGTKYVFVAEKEGAFTPRIVHVANFENDVASIESGLSIGERVVSGATFLVDSESRIQSSIHEANVRETK